MKIELEAYLTELAKRFVPKDSLEGIAKSIIRKENSSFKSTLVKNKAKRLVALTLKNLEQNSAWKTRLNSIFDKKYPQTTREFMCRGEFAYFGISDKGKANLSYDVQQVNSFASPSPKQLLHMAPKLTKIVGEEAKTSVEIDRLKNLDASAFEESALVSYEVLNRPAAGRKSKWDLSQPNTPKRIVAVKLRVRNPDLQIIEGFLQVIREAVAWKSSEDLYTYLAFLIQPLLVHLKEGMFPAYMFRGPTTSGKGLLSKKIPDLLYMSNLKRAVYQTKFPKDTYEMNISLNTAKDCLYYSCDEVKDLKEEQAKIFDNIVTASEVSIRVMREGTFVIPNHFTFSMAAVYSELTDETWGRIALIEVTGGRTQKYEKFLREWEPKFPELLAAICKKLSNNLELIKNYEVIEKRRPGFGLVAEATKNVFGVKPKFEVVKTQNQVLECICEIYSIDDIGDSRSGRKRLSVGALRKKFNADSEKEYSLSEFNIKLRTAMGTGSFRTYTSESGDSFKISLKEEGQDKRIFIYVKKS